MGNGGVKHACTGLALLCGLAAHDALADHWVKAASGKISMIYVDTDSMDRTGDIVSVWFRQDFTSPLSTEKHNGAYRSSKVLNYYNCAEHEAATAQFITYEGAGGKGKVLSSEKADSLEYSDVSSDEASKQVFNFVCHSGRKK